jgi:hypothetical protein
MISHRAVRLLLPGLIILSSCFGWSKAKLTDRSGAMKLEWKRSGGLAPITNTTGTLELSGTGGTVTANSGSYQRALDPSEAESLRSAMQPANLTKAMAAGATNSQLRDGYQYTFTISNAEGSPPQQLTVNAGGNANELQHLPQGTAYLLQWAEQESRKILKQRAGK